MAPSIMTFSIMAFRRMTFSYMTLNIIGVIIQYYDTQHKKHFIMLYILGTQHNDTQHKGLNCSEQMTLSISTFIGY